MKLSSKLVFIALLLSITSLACSIYAKGTPIFIEPKFEETNTETGAELKFSDKKDLHESYGYELDDETSADENFNAHNPIHSFLNGSDASAINKNARHSVPRYLLYCSLKIDFC